MFPAPVVSVQYLISLSLSTVLQTNKTNCFKAPNALFYRLYGMQALCNIFWIWVFPAAFSTDCSKIFNQMPTCHNGSP